MSGKRARYIRKKNPLPKKVVALCAGLCISCAPVAAEGEFLVSVFAPFTKPFGGKVDTLDMNFGMGGGLRLTYRPIKNIDFFAQGEYLSFSMDTKEAVDPISVFDASLGAGYHIPLSDRFSLDVMASGGAYYTPKGKGGAGFTAGLSLGFSYKVSPVISIDATASGTHFAAKPNPFITVNAAAAPGITFDITEMFNKSRKVDMQLAALAPVFPALYSWYEKNPFGTVTITNNEDTAITDVTVSFFQPQYMAHAKECMNIRKIEKGESVDVDLLAFFNEQMLELTEMTDTNSAVIVNYLCLGQKRTKTFTLDVPVYGRNNMSWDDDRRAAVFVSSKDPAAMRFAKHVTSIVREKKRTTVPVNIQYAMGIFEALNEFGINYVIDPSSAFEDNVGTSSIDFLQFPYQTLMFKGGDCDDLSILVCSLFESVGIKTAFITIPGHIFMAFDSGMTKAEADEKLRSLDNYIEVDDEVWIPLEITLSNEGFYKAYKYGAREWNKAYSEGTAAMYRMQDSWESYPPISVPGATEKFTMPTKKQISLAFEKSVDQWSFAELQDVLSLRPVKLVEATKENDNTGLASGKDNLNGLDAETSSFEYKEVAEAPEEPVEDPFAISTLFDVLELSGQAVAMNAIADMKLWKREEDIAPLKEPELEEEEEDEDEDDLEDDGVVIPVIAVNVPGPQELGIFVPGQEKVVVAKLEEKQEFLPMPPIKPVPTKTVTETKPVVQKPVSADNSGVGVTTTKTSVTTADTTSVTASDTTSIVPSAITSTTPSTTVETATQESGKKQVPVLPIAAITFTAIAAAGILIAYKKKESEGDKENK